jgi:CHAT domain-containing protein
MSWSTRRQLAMLAAEDGELAQAEQDLTSLIDTLTQQAHTIAGESDSANTYDLCRCLLDRASVRSWAVKLPEAMQDLERAELLANQQKPLNRRTLLIGVLEAKAQLLSTAFSPLYNPQLAHTTIVALRALAPEEWMVAAVEMRLAQQQHDWRHAIVQAGIIIDGCGQKGLVRGVNAARSAAARAWLELGQPKQAEPLAEQAWNFFAKNGPPDIAAQVALALARARGRSEDWPLAEQALSLTEQLTRAQRSLFDQQRYLVGKLQLYGDALRFALHLAETVPPGDARRIAVTRAWQVAERSKSFSLRQAMTQGGWLQALDPQGAAQLAEMEERLDALEAQRDTRETAVEPLAELSAQRSKMIEAAMAQNPLAAQAQAARPFSLQAVLDALPADVGVISWYWLEESDGWRLHIFYAGTDREPEHISTFWTANGVATLNNVRQASAKQHPFSVGQPLPAPLADKVFPPQVLTTLTDCHTLLLSPHRDLRQMPLHAAQITNVAPSNDATCLLIERFAVQVLPTLALPFPAQAEPPNVCRVLLMGCEQDGYRSKPLAHVPLELRILHDTWSAQGHIVSTHPLSPDARLDDHAPLSEWSRFDLIHLACHGRFVPQRPLDATLYLGSEALRATEFFTTRLNTRVICLSACDVGQHTDMLDGLALVSDEWLGLALPLFQAGTRAVLASLWQAESETACAFMQAFHHALAQGVTTARAHQLACLSQIKERFGFWANWQLAGFPN